MDGEREQKYIPLYYSYIEQLSLLPNDQIGQLVKALLIFGRDGTLPDFPKDTSLYMAFSFIADNSRRAADRAHESKVRGGRARASTAQKDEKGRFLPSESNRSPAETQQNPAESSTPSTSSYNNNKNKDNNKDKNNNNLLQKIDEEDCLSESDSYFLDLYRDMVGEFRNKRERDEFLELAAGMDRQEVIDVLTIAFENGAYTWNYVRKTFNTKRMHPSYKPKLL